MSARWSDTTPRRTSHSKLNLDKGEPDGIVLASALSVDGTLTDEFGGTNFPLIHAVLEGPRIVPTPRLVCDYARNGQLIHETANTLLTTIGSDRIGVRKPHTSFSCSSVSVNVLRNEWQDIEMFSYCGIIRNVSPVRASSTPTAIETSRLTGSGVSTQFIHSIKAWFAIQQWHESPAPIWTILISSSKAP